MLLTRRYGCIRQAIVRLQATGKALADAPDRQFSLTDPDARAMATSARNSSMAGYTVQRAIVVGSPIIVVHEVSGQGLTATSSARWGSQPKRPPPRRPARHCRQGLFTGITTTVLRPAITVMLPGASV
nr:hypothetical protein [Pseudogemmobacter bohemicus]